MPSSKPKLVKGQSKGTGRIYAYKPRPDVARESSTGRFVTRSSHSLGLKGVDNRRALINEIRQGFDVKVVDHFSSFIGVPVKKLVEYVDINPRTFARRRQSGRLHPDESDRMARLATLVEEAVELFEGDQEKAISWFKSPQKALAGATPLEYADTVPGVQEVRDLIGRLEHGVFS